MAFRAPTRQPHSVGRVFIALAMTLLLTAVAAANVLGVPEDYTGIQAAMDATDAGDTVLVNRGTWVGLLDSPAHSILLASHYLLTQDSTDINETILDGEYEGTILTVNTVEEECLSVRGFTFWRGQGQQTDIYFACDRGGAVHTADDANLCIEDVVFLENRAPRLGSVLFFGRECSISNSGNLTLRRIACYRNSVNVHSDISNSIYACSREGDRFIVDQLYYDGAGDASSPMQVNAYYPRELLLQGITMVNSDGGRCHLAAHIADTTRYTIRDIKSTSPPDMGGCHLMIELNGPSDETSTFQLSNIEVSGGRSRQALHIGGGARFEVDTLHIHDNVDIGLEQNVGSAGEPLAMILSSVGGSVRHLNMHHNQIGDSSGTYPSGCLLKMSAFDLLDSHIHDNHVIIPVSPTIGNGGGNALDGAMVTNYDYANDRAIRIENVLFENNLVDDLEEYSDLTPANAYGPNRGRELLAKSDTIFMRNVTILNSRQPNHCPELVSNDEMEFSYPGRIVKATARLLVMEHLRAVNCDDGGFSVGADTLLARDIVLNDVRRGGFWVGQYNHYAVPKYWSFRNIWIDNTDASDEYLYLHPGWEVYSAQTAFLNQLGRPSIPDGILPKLVLENVSITHCDDMRRLFNFWNDIDLRMKNCLVASNSYEILVGWVDPIEQSWSHSYVQEAVEGEGNLLGNDPLFDPERGIPFLAPDSPCIDAGHPDAAYNDLEDPDAPGFALWPSQGGLRNDIGCTGGPFAKDSMFVSLAPATPITLPTSPTLGDAYPNPFNPVTTIPFVIHYPTHLHLAVYNLRGQQIATLANDAFLPGEHRVTFDGSSLASGVYLICLRGEDVSQSSKVLLLK